MFDCLNINGVKNFEESKKANAVNTEQSVNANKLRVCE